jgi:hypothetical protein
MATCPFCQATYVANTVFCHECGHYLLEADKRETDPLDVKKNGWVGQPVNGPQLDSSLPVNARRVAIRLKIGPEKREIEVPLQRSIHLGRVDPALDVYPEIDLTPYNSLGKSISRRHATISRQGDTVVIEDMGSINGTFVNGKRLDPYLPELLKSGDILQLGKLLMEVEIRKQ